VTPARLAESETSSDLIVFVMAAPCWHATQHRPGFRADVVPAPDSPYGMDLEERKRLSAEGSN
jgi:hypothetical protein